MEDLLDEKVIGYIFTLAGLACIVLFTAHGASEGLVLVSTATALHIRKKKVVYLSFVASSYALTVFLFGFIVNCLMITKYMKDMSLSKGMTNFCLALLFAVPSCVAGCGIGGIYKKGISSVISEGKFSMVFFFALTTIELVTILSLVLFVVFK